MGRFGSQVQERIDEAKAKIKDWSQADFDRHQHEAQDIEIALAQAMADGLPIDSKTVSELIGRLHNWVGRGWNRVPNRQAFKGLADIYADHPDFRARYEGRRAGLTDYLVKAVKTYAERELA